MHRPKLNKAGFTLIEMLVFILAITALGTIGVINVRNIRAHHRDKTGKSEINTINYFLEAFYEKNGYYPATADSTTLTGINTETLKDKNGLMINSSGSAYRYRPHHCTDAKCQSFDLEVELEKEAVFAKKSLNN
jgi:Tfp pilus assembly protein PilE